MTIPFKQDVLEHVEPDELAARIGAVNTIAFTDETPRGYNTDAAGAAALHHHDVSLSGRRSSLGPAVRGERSRSVSPTRGCRCGSRTGPSQSRRARR